MNFAFGDQGTLLKKCSLDPPQMFVLGEKPGHRITKPEKRYTNISNRNQIHIPNLPEKNY
jgi:hypothetical protein